MTDKQPWITHPHIWKTKGAFISFIRGGLRKSIWSRYPIKLEYIKKHRKRVLNKNTGNTVFGGTCYLCGEDFPQNQLEVDHKRGNNQFTDLDNLESYLKALLYIDEDDLALACKLCHKVKSHAERKGVTFEEAKVEKAVIAFMKKPVKDIKKVLDENGLASNNIATRREGVTKLFSEGVLK